MLKIEIQGVVLERRDMYVVVCRTDNMGSFCCLFVSVSVKLIVVEMI